MLCLSYICTQCIVKLSLANSRIYWFSSCVNRPFAKNNEWNSNKSVGCVNYGEKSNGLILYLRDLKDFIVIQEECFPW